MTSLKSLLKVNGYAHVADDVTIGRDKRGKGKIEVGVDFPTIGEIKRLVEHGTNPRLRALLLTVALTGLRASELQGLRWSDVDLAHEELHVRQRADRYGKIGSPKSELSRRTVPLAPETLAALKVWKLACPISEGNFVFPTSKGRIEHHKNMLRSLAALMIGAKVADKNGRPKYALHAFRHFFASWCINPVDRGGRGLQAKEVQEASRPFLDWS